MGASTDDFGKDYWERHWQDGARGSMATSAANPYLAPELGDLDPGTALDAGCGAGAEAVWLAEHGWAVTAADISAAALARARERAGRAAVTWVEADLSTWEPDERFDLVMTHYAHPAMLQLDFYDRIAGWVAPGGTLLIVGHLHHEGHDNGHGHGHEDESGPPRESQVTAAAITERLDPADWHVVTAEETHRAVGEDQPFRLHDVVVRAVRRSHAPAPGKK